MIYSSFLSTIITLSETVETAEKNKLTGVEIMRTGEFQDARYGNFEITSKQLASIVENFTKNTFGQDIVLDLNHKPDQGAAGFFKKIYVDGNKLLGEVEFTSFGLDSIKQKGFKYLSPEYDEDYGGEYGATLLGVALTLRPVIKNQKGIKLSKEQPTLDTSQLDAINAQVEAIIAQRELTATNLATKQLANEKLFDELTEKATEVSKKVGKVNVDVGGTACKVPLATDYIKKVAERGNIGKKRKAARC